MLTRTALALLLLLAPVASAQDLDTAVSALVRISGTRGETPVRGSGFVIGLDHDKATIVTASHVIKGVQQLEVTFAVDRTRSFPAGTVLGMDFDNLRGLAVFQVRGAPAGVTSLSFETEALLQRGEDVFLLGFPEMVTAPITLRMSFAGPDGNFLQLDRPAGEGLSGAPVLRKSKVVGVVTAEDLWLTYAVKATVAQDAVVGWGGSLGGKSSTRVGSTATSTGPAPPAAGNCAPGEKRTMNGIVFVRICPGTFTMGSAENDPHAQDREDEKPAHQVTLSEFWIGETEITNEEYRGFRKDHQGEADLPVTHISWFDAKAACEHFGGRLPTEAEWEYAARAGSQTTWSFGDDERMLDEYAWYEGNSGYSLHRVASRRSNDWGLYDMHGNVWEWVADWDGRYSRKPQTDPQGPPTSNGPRVVRGGSIFYPPTVLRSALRNRHFPREWDRDIGFRCVAVMAHESPKSKEINLKPCSPGEKQTAYYIIFVRMCPGTFTMGSAKIGLRTRRETPAHQVTLSELWISQTEITNEQYQDFRPDHQGEAGLPVTGISWAEAKATCEHFGGRLPTEAEWEYAARAGSQAAWSFGNDEKRLGEHAWYGEKSGRTPHPVRMKKANAWGLYDIYGNVSEWVADWYGDYPSAAQTNPLGPTKGETRVVRGGSFADTASTLRSAFRGGSRPEDRSIYIGFRCVLSLRP